MAVGARVISVRGSKLDSDFVAASQVRIGYLRVGNLKRRLVLDVEYKLGLGEFGLAPVPASQSMLLGLEVYAVPVLEDLA